MAVTSLLRGQTKSVHHIGNLAFQLIQRMVPLKHDSRSDVSVLDWKKKILLLFFFFFLTAAKTDATL